MGFFSSLKKLTVGRFIGRNIKSPNTAALLSLVPHPAAQLAAAGLKGYNNFTRMQPTPAEPIEPPTSEMPTTTFRTPGFRAAGDLGAQEYPMLGPMAGIASMATSAAHHALRQRSHRSEVGRARRYALGRRPRRRKRRGGRGMVSWSTVTKLLDAACIGRDVYKNRRQPSRLGPTAYDLMQDHREAARAPRRRSRRRRGPHMTAQTKAYLREYHRTHRRRR